MSRPFQWCDMNPGYVFADRAPGETAYLFGVFSRIPSVHGNLTVFILVYICYGIFKTFEIFAEVFFI